MKIFSTLKKQATSFLEQYKQQSPATYAAAEQAIGAVLITDGFIGIDNPFGGKKRPGIFGTVVGVIFGILFLFIPTIFGNLSGVNSMTATTQGTVVAVGMNTNTVRSSNSSSSSSNSCSVTARYTVDGKEYTNQSSISSSSNCGLAAGQAITVNYNPDNPGSWTNDVKTVGIVLQVFFWVGVLMIVSGIITFFIRLFSIIYGWKLVKDGRKLAGSLPQGTDLQTIISEIKQNFIGTVFNFGGGGAASMGGIGGMVSSMTNPTQPPAQPPVQPIQTTQPPTQPIQPTQPPAQPTQTPPPTSQNETPPNTGPSTSGPTDLSEPKE